MKVHGQTQRTSSVFPFVSTEKLEAENEYNFVPFELKKIEDCYEDMKIEDCYEDIKIEGFFLLGLDWKIWRMMTLLFWVLFLFYFLNF